MGFTFTHIIIKLNTLVWHCSTENDDGDDDDKTFLLLLTSISREFRDVKSHRGESRLY